VRPSVANFILLDVDDVEAFRRALLSHGMVVRDWTSFGLPSRVRIACRLPDGSSRLLFVVKMLKQ
jgi:histidinol-phosphate/aromatic aminotransferase/cobyric acid decarboxylase-like protein